MRTAACLPLVAVAALMGCVEQADTAAPGSRVPVDARPPEDVPQMNDGHVEPRDVALAADTSVAMDVRVPDALVATDASSNGDAMGEPDAAPQLDAEADAARPMIDECFGMLLDDAPFVADYASFDPVLGRHCRGSDHQDIDAVEQVVFVGDALVAGLPQWQAHRLMRFELAERLSERFGLHAPEPAWQEVDPLTGQPALRRSGDFVACAHPSAAAADLLEGRRLLIDCLLPDEHQQRTLFVIAVGIHDVRRLTESLAEGVGDAQVLSAAGAPVDALERAVRWIKDPARFPAGSFAILANVPDWTDGRGDTAACPNWPALAEDRQPLFGRLMAQLNGQYMRVAVEQRVDLVFVQEHFCGHGRQFRNPDPLCLGVPEAWVDDRCLFLRPPGDAALTRLFWDVITDAE